MSEGSKTPEIAAKASQTGDGAITQEALKRAEAYIEEEEGAANQVSGLLGVFLIDRKSVV